MSERFDMDVVRGVLVRLEAERAQELAVPDKPVVLRDTIALCGTRGFVGGCVGWAAIALVIVASSGGEELREVLIATPFGIGVMAALGAVVGMVIALPIWLLRRSHRSALANCPEEVL